MARIRHLAILTENVEKLVSFYTTAFGLKIVLATWLADLVRAEKGDGLGCREFEILLAVFCSTGERFRGILFDSGCSHLRSPQQWGRALGSLPASCCLFQVEPASGRLPAQFVALLLRAKSR